MIGANGSLEDTVRSYLSTQDLFKLNEYRNAILLSATDAQAQPLLAILDSIYEKAEDPGERRNVLKLLYELVSRTEKVFPPTQVIGFLTKCLKWTICVTLCVSATRALVERHFDAKDDGLCDKLAKFYELLASKKIYTLPQQVRLDFLAVTKFVVGLYGEGRARSLRAGVVTGALAGEKDPRNLLVMFDVLGKVAKTMANRETEFEEIARTVSVYYPINFVPPKDDKVGITPSQLKKALFECLTADERLAPHALEIVIDSLYSEYKVNDQQLAAVADSLRFLKNCKPIFKHDFKRFAKPFVEAMKMELGIGDYDDEDGEAEDAAYRARDASGKAYEAAMDAANKFMWDVVAKVPRDDIETGPEEGARIDITEVRLLGAAHYREWKHVDEKVKMFGEIARLFGEGIEEMDAADVKALLTGLRRKMHANQSLGYLVDVLCERPKLHPKILHWLVKPLLADMVPEYRTMYEAWKRGEQVQEAEPGDFGGTLTVLSRFALPKMLMHFEHCTVPFDLINLTMYLTQVHQLMRSLGHLEREHDRAPKLLKLLGLVFCISSSRITQLLILSLMRFLLGHKYMTSFVNCSVLTQQELAPMSRTRTRYFEILVNVYKCNFERMPGVVSKLAKILMSNFRFFTPDTDRLLEVLSVFQTQEGKSDASVHVAELYRATLIKYAQGASHPMLNGFAYHIARLAFSALYALCGGHRPDNRVEPNGHDGHNGTDGTEADTTQKEDFARRFRYFAVHPEWAEDLRQIYASLFVEVLDCLPLTMVRMACTDQRLIECFRNLLALYENTLHKTVSNLEASFWARKAPEILGRLLETVRVDLGPRPLPLEPVLNVYMKNPNWNFDCVKTLEENARHGDWISLLNAEAILAELYAGGPDTLLGLTVFNGPLLVSYVQKTHPFDFKTVTDQIQMLRGHDISHLDYIDLFFPVIPLCVDAAPAIARRQLINIRTQVNKREWLRILKPKKAGDGDGASLANGTDHPADQRERLVGRVKEMLNADHPALPGHYAGPDLAKFSKVELHVALMCLLLNRGASHVAPEELRTVLNGAEEVMDTVTGCLEAPPEGTTPEYTLWCCEKYLLYIQALMFEVLTKLNRGKCNNEELTNTLWGRLEALGDRLVRAYEWNRVKGSRIMTVLTLHGIMSAKAGAVSKQWKAKVNKGSSTFLGDPSKTVRSIAVVCRREWFATLQRHA